MVEKLKGPKKLWGKEKKGGTDKDVFNKNTNRSTLENY